MQKIVSSLESYEENLREIEELFEDRTRKALNNINSINYTVRRMMCRNLAARTTKHQSRGAAEQVVDKKTGGKIRVGRIRGRLEKGKKYPVTDGFLNVVVTSHNQTKLGHLLSPYKLADDQGRLMENLWQFAKVYEKVHTQKQKDWIWPAENHCQNGKLTDEYWAWRKAGMEHTRPIRYPNGFKGRAECLYALWPTNPTDDPIDQYADMQQYGYIEARTAIYAPLYIKMAKREPEFAQLREMLNEGYNLQILDVDGPDDRPKGEKSEIVAPYDSMEQGIHGVTSGVGSIEINEENIQLLLADPLQPFGHGYCLAVALLGKEQEWGLTL